MTSTDYSTQVNAFSFSSHEKAQAYKQEDEFMSKFYANQKKILEINPNHPLILGLLEKAKSGFDDTTKELVHVLYETNLIRSGYQLKDSIT